MRFILSHLLPLDSILSLSYHTLHSGHAKRGRRKEEKNPKCGNQLIFLFQFLTFACCYCHAILSVNILEQQLNSFVSCRRLIAVWIRSERRRRNEWRRFCVQFQLSIYKSIKGLLSFLLSLYGLIKNPINFSHNVRKKYTTLPWHRLCAIYISIARK